MSHFRKIMLGAFVIILLQCSISLAFQRKLIFHERPLPANHVFTGQYPAQEYFFERTLGNGEKVRLNALYYLPEGKRTGTVFYLHGTLGNLQTQEKHTRDFVKRGYAVFIFNYRTYGKSTGKIYSEDDLHDDAAWIYRRFKEMTRLNDDEIVIAGRSLGTGLAVPLAAEVNPKCLVLISPYYDLADVAKHFIPYLPKPLISKVLRFGFHTDARIADVKCPLYIFHGNKDRIIPYSSGKKLEPFTQKGKFITVPGASHLNITRFETFQVELDSVLNN